MTKLDLFRILSLQKLLGNYPTVRRGDAMRRADAAARRPYLAFATSWTTPRRQMFALILSREALDAHYSPFPKRGVFILIHFVTLPQIK
jgi:hypothetical protein